MDRSKVGKRSRNKGASFERAISKRFSEWLGCKVRRTPMSGAYGSDWHLGGDLMFDIDVPWYVELKNREAWRLEQIFAAACRIPAVMFLPGMWVVAPLRHFMQAVLPETVKNWRAIQRKLWEEVEE
jgi:hypothetical protein